MKKLKYFVALIVGTLMMIASIFGHWFLTQYTIEVILFIGIITFFLGMFLAYLIEDYIEIIIEDKKEKRKKTKKQRPNEPTLFELDKSEWDKNKRMVG